MRAFEGIRILDLTHVLAGPFCAYQLGLLGAEIIKIENPHSPDQSRRNGVDNTGNDAGMGTHYLTQGGGKRALALDLAHPMGREVLRRLAARADVLIENFRPGALAALGCGPADLRTVNPRLLYCSISAFGQSGPRASQTAYDIVIQAVSGLMDLNGSGEAGPLRLGAPVIDYGTGMAASFAISAALFARTRTGCGEHLDVAMSDVARSMMAATLTGFLHTGHQPRRQGNALPLPTQGVFETRDGLLMIAANNTRQQQRLWAFAGQPARFRADRPTRIAHAEDDRAALATFFRGKTADDWEAALQKAGVPAARVRGLGDAMADAQVTQRGAYPALTMADGAPVRVPLLPFRSETAPAIPPEAPPALGQDSEAVLRDHGFAPHEITALMEQGVVVQYEAPKPPP